MQTVGFPACCTATIVKNLGQGGQGLPDQEESVAAIKKYLEGRIKVSQNHAFISCVTNNNQKNANEALRAMGFKSTKWLSKNQYPGTKVRLWHYEIKK